MYRNSLENKSQYLDGFYKQRTDPINKCYQAAKTSKPLASIFIILDGGFCSSGKIVDKHYKDEGKSSNCKLAGTGARYAFNAYKIMGKYLEC